MSKSARYGLCITAYLLLVSCGESPQPESTTFLPQYEKIDILIENGSIFDGSGRPPVRANVAIVGEQIVFVGETEFTEQEAAVKH